jgi:beta-glucanase (GH16 family)
MFTRSLRNFQQSFPDLVRTAGSGAIASWRYAAALVLLAGLTACGGVSDEIPAGNYVPPPIEWQLAFADEFDGDTLDAGKWNVDTGDGCPDFCGWGNNELQSYTADNIQVAGGVLTIQGRQEADGSYTSARINTRGKFDFTYGRVEISARLPEGKGIWPAIWMLPSDETVYGPWPRGGEIDIMEAFNPGVDGNTSTKSTTHYGLPTGPTNGTSSANDLGVSPSLGFHEYTMEWERDTMRFFVDGVHFQTQKASNWYSYFPADGLGYFNEYGAFKLGPRDAPFDQLFHLILNLAIGGDPVGNPDASTVFPQNFEIDYIRVYECVNSNPDTERGCGVADASVVPLKDNDGGPLQNVETAQPYLERLDLYVDGPEVIELNVGGEVATNTLQVNGYTSDGASVINDPMAADPDDAENTVWHVAVSGGVANVYLESQDLTDDLILDTGFNFSGNRNVGPGGDPVGEVAFDMLVNSIDEGTDLLVKLDSGYPNLGQVVIPATEIAVGAWKTYSVKFDMLLGNPLDGGAGVDLANVANPFVFEVQNGAADVYIDNIRVTNACKVVGACGADLKTKGVPDLVVFDDAVNTAVWGSGIGASDSGSGYNDYFVGTNPADKVNWSILADTDPDRGNVIQVTFNDSDAFGVWFVKSPVPVDANAYNSGAVVFDLKVLDYGSNTTGMTFKIDCLYPCTSGDKALGVVADGVWETITFPVSQLTSTGLDLSNVNTGIVIFPTTQAGGITFQLDNIRWVASSDAIPLAPVDLPVTFDDPGVDYALTNFGGAGSVIGNDPVGGTNQVAITTKGAVDAPSEVWAGTTIGPAGGFASAIPFAAGQTTMSVKVYSPAVGVPVLLKVETEDNTVATSEVQVLTTVAGAWETLVFDFSGGAPAIDLSQAYVRANIFFDFGTAGTGQTYYWDDVYFGDGAPPALSQIDLPVTFEDPSVDYYTENFSGAATILVNDPIVGASNTVAMTTKNGDPWAGTIVGTVDGFATPIPFTAADTKLSVRVLSPAANIPIMLKIENADATSFLELTVNNTVADAWETLEFDYSTLGIDPSIVWVRAIIFFDFLNPANGASYYWDDVQFVNPPAQTKIVFDEAVDPTWDAGITGSDSGCGWCGYTDGTNPANKSNWQIIADEDVTHGQVIDITFNDSAEFGVWFIGSSGPVDMSAYAAGNLVFDIRVLDYGSNLSGMTMKVDCGYPCTSGDQPIGVVGAGGVWETVTIPVAQLVGTGLNLATVNTGLVVFPTEQVGTINFRLDNIRWEP